MRKYVLIPDSFKGTLSSREVCQIVAEAIRSQEPEAEICAIPVAAGCCGRWCVWCRCFT